MASPAVNRVYQSWRYAISQDFTTADGKPFPYADNGKQQWGDEIGRICFDGAEPHGGCVSDDGKHLAISVGQDIHIIDVQSSVVTQILRGHVSRISALAFQPQKPNILVSSAADDHDDSRRGVDPVIIVWDINKAQDDYRANLWDDVLHKAATDAATATEVTLQGENITLTTEELQELKEAFKPGVTRVVRQHLTAENIRIHGRLQTNFQSQIFSPSGTKMAYITGKRAQGNGPENWEIRACSTDEFTSGLVTFHGHTDHIAWTGWNNDETMFGSVSWDQTVRIWDTATGQQKYCFTTGYQSWSGAFSPDSKYFAATSGKGAIFIYSLSEGLTHWEYKDEQALSWVRAAAWHPNSRWLAIGGRQNGTLLLFDVYSKEIIQTRTLSTDKSTSGDDHSTWRLSRLLEVSKIQFFDCGNKLALWTQIDCSIEIYDLSNQVKWRFACAGTEDELDDEKRLTSNGGKGMLVCDKEIPLLASIDFDSVRLWALKSHSP